MPSPRNPYRYIGKIYRPDGHITEELFRSIKDARHEAESRSAHGTGSAYRFQYDLPGLSLELDRNDIPFVHETNVIDRLEQGSVIELRAVHRNGGVDPMPTFRVTVGPRNGTSVVRLRPGKEY